jgi:hypothetical protein
MTNLELMNWVLALEPEGLPPVPFKLTQHETIFDSSLYIAFLQRDIRLGPRGSRARNGVLLDDIRQLWKIANE